MRIVVELHCGRVEPALTLDPDVMGTVDHDFGDAVVGEEALERPVAEGVVGDLGGDAVAIVAREPALLRQVAADVGEYAFLEDSRVGRDVEELRPEIADDAQVDGVLQRGEGVGAA